MVSKAYSAFYKILNDVIKHGFGKSFMGIYDAFIHIAFKNLNLFQCLFKLNLIICFYSFPYQPQSIAIRNRSIVIIFMDIIAKGIPRSPVSYKSMEFQLIQ